MLKRLLWIDETFLKAADFAVEGCWRWMSIERGMLIRITIVVWLGVAAVQGLWIDGRLDLIQLGLLPVVLLISLIDERQLLKIAPQPRTGHLIARRCATLNFGLRQSLVILAIAGVIQDFFLPYPLLCLCSDLSLLAFAYLNDALFPTAPSAFARATASKKTPAATDKIGGLSAKINVQGLF